MDNTLPQFPLNVPITPREVINLSNAEYDKRIASIQRRLSPNELESLHVFRLVYRSREQNRRYQKKFREKKAAALLLLHLADAP
jgi:hypothetical protein